jgi:hypothetical protein
LWANNKAVNIGIYWENYYTCKQDFILAKEIVKLFILLIKKILLRFIIESDFLGKETAKYLINLF